jgi:hypothetical protein
VHEETAIMRAYPTNNKMTTMAVLASALILALVASLEAFPLMFLLNEHDHDPCKRVYHCRSGIPHSIEIECRTCCSENGNRYHNVAMVANNYYECTCWKPKRRDRGDDIEDEWDDGPVIPYDVDDYPSDMRAGPYEEEQPCDDIDYSRIPPAESEKECKKCCLRHKASSYRIVKTFGYDCECVWDERKGRRSRARSTRQVANYD